MLFCSIDTAFLPYVRNAFLPSILNAQSPYKRECKSQPISAQIIAQFSCRTALQSFCCWEFGGIAMAILTVTARGQVTFRKDVLRHLGVKPGEKIELELMPGGKGMIGAARKTGSIEDFIGVLAGKTRKTAAIGEIVKASERGWAGMR
jgi:bifunctional DNA-binding transcriptional regulator/antitoxin component of YhaV-PrlF toxin-antitoxin module